MGQILARLMEVFGGMEECRILMLGLDAAGKTTVLYKLKLGENVTTIPTIGFNLETVQYRNVSFIVWDVGGQEKIRRLWKHYFQHTQGLIFVVDSSDRERVYEAEEELHNLMRDDHLANVKLLVLANKADLPNAMPLSELTAKLQLPNFKKNKWFIQSSCATTGEGLYEGLDWLASALKQKS